MCCMMDVTLKCCMMGNFYKTKTGIHITIKQWKDLKKNSNKGEKIERDKGWCSIYVKLATT